MIYNIAVKGCVLSDETLAYVEKHLTKLAKYLPNFNPDAPFLDLIIRKQKIHLDHYIQRTPVNGTSIKEVKNPKTQSPVYYEGIIKIILPRKPLVIRMKGNTIDEAINDGFKQINKKIKTYRGKHFPSDSEYYDKKSIKESEEE
ncbi:hypothetical protein C4559_02505 [Candidatus Microgenomates bacterium]|nr:MAG: hypothetical protein C4559_02505 [Candidatus Microgenomates bacterium]